MKKLCSICCLTLLIGCSVATFDDIFEKYLWKNRVLVVLSSKIDHEDYVTQLDLITNTDEAFNERDMVIWHIVNYEYVMVNGAQKPQLPAKQLSDYFNANNDGLTVILLGKDGEEKLRSNTPVSADKIIALVDAMPMRQQEMQP